MSDLATINTVKSGRDEFFVVSSVLDIPSSFVINSGQIVMVKENGGLYKGDGVSSWSSLSSDIESYGAFGGNICAVLGDSLANNGEGVAWWIAAASSQRLSFPSASYVVSHPGYTSTLIAGLTSEITSLDRKPKYCFVSVGSNDAAMGVPAATFMSNVTTIYSALRLVGITPIAMAVPPRVGVRGLIGDYNWRLYRYAAALGIPFLDQWDVLADGVTEVYQTRYNSDGIHPNAAGCKAVAQLAATALASIAPAPPSLASLAISSINIQPVAMHLADGGTAGLATGYGVTPSSGFSYSRVADSGGAGWSWQRVTLATASGVKTVNGSAVTIPTLATTLSSSAAASATALTTTGTVTTGGAAYRITDALGTSEVVRVNSVSGSGPYTVTLSTLTPTKFAHSAGATLTPACAIGDTLGFAIRCRSAQDAANLCPQFTIYNAGQASVLKNIIMTTPNVATGFTRQLDDCTLYQEAVLPANSAVIQFSFAVGATDGTYDFALPLVANVTAMGG